MTVKDNEAEVLNATAVYVALKPQETKTYIHIRGCTETTKKHGFSANELFM